MMCHIEAASHPTIWAMSMFLTCFPCLPVNVVLICVAVSSWPCDHNILPVPFTQAGNIWQYQYQYILETMNKNKRTNTPKGKKWPMWNTIISATGLLTHAVNRSSTVVGRLTCGLFLGIYFEGCFCKKKLSSGWHCQVPPHPIRWLPSGAMIPNWPNF